MDIEVSLVGLLPLTWAAEMFLDTPPGRKPNALALTLLRFLAQASQFHVTDTSAALNIPFLPAFSPHCNRS